VSAALTFALLAGGAMATYILLQREGLSRRIGV
jgi:hypothetical protein